MKKPRLKLYTVVCWKSYIDEDMYVPEYIMDFGMQIEAFCVEEARNIFIEYQNLEINADVSVLGVFEEGCDDVLKILRFEDRPSEFQKVPRHIGDLNKYYEITEAQRKAISLFEDKLGKSFHGITRLEATIFINKACSKIQEQKKNRTNSFKRSPIVYDEYEDYLYDYYDLGDVF